VGPTSLTRTPAAHRHNNYRRAGRVDCNKQRRVGDGGGTEVERGQQETAGAGRRRGAAEERTGGANEAE